MVKKRDEQSGRYTATVDDAEIVAYLRDQGGAGTSDVAEYFEYERPSAYRRLKDLEGTGRVVGREVGNSILWLATGDGGEGHASARESAGVSGEESAGDGSTSQPPGDGGDRSPVPHGDESEGESAPLDDVLAELPSTVDPDAARDAILAARDYLEKRGQATKGDFVRGVMRDHPLGYDPDAALAKIEGNDRYRGSWWRNAIKPGLTALEDVEKPPKGASDWKLADSEPDE
ncbi:hypothetical protein [Halorubrum ezzemoulense]|uniref:hypothetical protein n=1 Tax=Halorubrum ezzemoulense TaxID=337243 RepID=UPI00232BE145|nr:hypothetical protein [Halorubrum ezzemoulense]